MSTTKHLTGTLTDSAGQSVAVDGTVTVYDAPTAAFSGLPTTGVTAGATVTGKLTGTVDSALTVKSRTVTVDGVAVTVAADGTFSFTA